MPRPGLQALGLQSVMRSQVFACLTIEHSVCYLLDYIRGVEILDQALQGAKAILNGNENAGLILFAPVAASKADQHASLIKRRLLEDKLMLTLWLNQSDICFPVLKAIAHCSRLKTFSKNKHLSLALGTLNGKRSASTFLTLVMPMIVDEESRLEFRL